MKEIIKKRWNESAHDYNKSVRRSLHSKREKNAWQEIFTEALGKEKLKILDVGTGPGIVAFLLTELGHDVKTWWEYCDRRRKLVPQPRRFIEKKSMALSCYAFGSHHRT